MPTAVAIRHVPFEDLGLLGDALADRGWAVSYLEAGLEPLALPDRLGPELLVVLGGPIGVYEEEDYPFLGVELRLVEERLKAGRPTLGLCLGAQIMAAALGARVYPGGAKEIGWAPIALTEAGRASPLRHLDPQETDVLHWHGDTFDLPEGAERLASTALYENQAFRWGDAALALQFHPEVTADALERWLIGHTVEIAATPGVTVAKLRADAQRWDAALRRQARLCFDEWLDELGVETSR
jgi:GMP synthase (glutamine-hydrolysing)